MKKNLLLERGGCRIASNWRVSAIRCWSREVAGTFIKCACAASCPFFCLSNQSLVCIWSNSDRVTFWEKVEPQISPIPSSSSLGSRVCAVNFIKRQQMTATAADHSPLISAPNWSANFWIRRCGLLLLYNCFTNLCTDRYFTAFDDLNIN